MTDPRLNNMPKSHTPNLQKLPFKEFPSYFMLFISEVSQSSQRFLLEGGGACETAASPGHHAGPRVLHPEPGLLRVPAEGAVPAAQVAALLASPASH